MRAWVWALFKAIGTRIIKGQCIIIMLVLLALDSLVGESGFGKKVIGSPTCFSLLHNMNSKHLPKKYLKYSNIHYNGMKKAQGYVSPNKSGPVHVLATL